MDVMALVAEFAQSQGEVAWAMVRHTLLCTAPQLMHFVSVVVIALGIAVLPLEQMCKCLLASLRDENKIRSNVRAARRKGVHRRGRGGAVSTTDRGRRPDFNR